MGRISKNELYAIKRKFISKYIPYNLTFYSEFDFDLLGETIIYNKKAGRGATTTYNDVILMMDTETSKLKVNTTRYEEKSINGSVVKLLKYNPVPNYVVAWTLSIRAFNQNIATLYGNTPSELTDCIEKLQTALKGDETYIYWHNMSYDWVFIRRHMFQKFGHPERQLNTKSHYPIFIKFANGVCFRDSLCLAQRKLEKWADDLNVEHKKAVEEYEDENGNKHKFWDYDKIRNQHGYYFNSHELTYIEHDTLAGVECIDVLMNALHKHIYSMPYTATGIPREECRKIGKKNGARDSFLKVVLDYERYIQATRVYHGGYTHANRYKIERLIANVICRDFSSSYPAVMLTEKYPSEAFQPYEECSLDDILEMSGDYAFMFKLILLGDDDKPIHLKDLREPMPALQYSKCVKIVNDILDNGRVLQADYVEIYLNEIDARIIKEQYSWSKHICTEVYYSRKDYLPRWFTDYVYTLYSDKCTLKDGDPVLYALAKAKLNSLYGMCVQKSLKENLVEDYLTGEYTDEPVINPDTGEPYTEPELYQKYIENNNSVLPYQWGVWVTSFAMYNLFTLSKCCVRQCEDGSIENGFVYSDTDSIYSEYWNEEKLKEYNDNVLLKLRANNYEPVEYNGKTFIPGLAEFDGAYSEFKTLGAKRYCCRYSYDERNKEKNRGKLKITVAGVPKSGVKCLNDDINNFTTGFIFPGTETGKLTHHYIIEGEIVTENGNERGDSIDLTPCDYLLSSVYVYDDDELYQDEIEIQVYD